MTEHDRSDRSAVSRRTVLLAAGAAIPVLMGGASRLRAQLSGEQREGQIRPIPVAITDFLGADPRLASDVAAVIAADLQNSGLFQIIDRAAHIERVQNINTAPRFADWRAAGAEAIIVGQVGQLPDGRVQVEARVWDVVLGKPLAGNRLATPIQNWRRVAHQAADIAYEKLTGGGRYFDTRIVFIDETGPKDKRRKRLAMMDQDGANVRLLSQGSELVLTPRFSPTSQEITYMSYVGQQPRVVLMNIDSGQREVVGDFPGMTFAPRFSPDGQRIIMSVGQGGSTSLVEMDLRSRRTRAVTQTDRIDTGPCYAPSGREIVFESDRGGTQQLYVMGWDGTAIRRISNGDGRYSTPVWSPRGDYIAFTKQLGGRFLIGVMKPDGSGERVLTEGFHNEGPTWAPNGRVLMFFRESPGANGGARLWSVDITGYNERQVATPAFGSDPAWSPLLS